MGVLLQVPQIPQWGSTANLRRTDCGVACVAMLLSFYKKLNGLTVDQLVKQTPLVNSDNGLTPYWLTVLAKDYGLPTTVHLNTTLSTIRDELDQGRPVIALIAYRDIPGKLDKNDNTPGKDGHFITVIGYDDNHFIVDDPDYWPPYTEQGHNLYVLNENLDKAIQDSGYTRSCVFVEKIKMSDNDFLKKIDGELKAIEAEVEAQETTTTPPGPTPEPSNARKMVVVSGLYVRDAPSTSGKALGLLTAGTAVDVVDDVTADGHKWGKVVSGSFAGTGYVAEEFLAPKA